MQDEMEKVREAQRLMEISAQAVHDSRLEYQRLASDFDEAEGTLNEGLDYMHRLIAEMTTATSAMSTGTGDRGESETKHLQDALFLLIKMLNEEDVAVGSSSTS